MMAMEEAQKLSTTEKASLGPNPSQIVGEDESGSKKLAYDQYPLEHRWTFWFNNRKSKRATWGSSMRSIYTFSSAEEFWSVYNNIPHPSKLPAPADFHCFKYNIEPKWEDPVCANGGKWTLTFQKEKCDNSWLYTFDYGDEICGAVVSVRGRQDKIALWTKNASNEAAQLSIGRQWKEFLNCNEPMKFMFHEDAQKHGRAAKNRYAI